MNTLKALIAYATRYGATTGTSEEIAKILREEGIDTRIVNLKEEKIRDISEYDLILVGSGMRMGKWDEIRNWAKELSKKALTTQ